MDGFLERASALIREIERLPTRSSFDWLALDSLRMKVQFVLDGEREQVADLPLDHLIHGDYHALNVLIDEERRVAWVLDLDDCRGSDRMRELVRAMDYLCGDWGPCATGTLDRSTVFPRS